MRRITLRKFYFLENAVNAESGEIRRERSEVRGQKSEVRGRGGIAYLLISSQILARVSTMLDTDKGSVLIWFVGSSKG